MKNRFIPLKPAAGAFASLLFALVAPAQEATPDTSTSEKDQELTLSTYVVTTVNRTGKSIDRIPGAVNLIKVHDI